MTGPPKENGPRASGDTRPEPKEVSKAKQVSFTSNASKPQAKVIEKSANAQIRVALKTWRGETRVEVREHTATIPGIFMSTASGFTLEIGKVPELIAALRALTRRRAP